MQNTYETLKRHLRNAIYIENGFGLNLFTKKVEVEHSSDTSEVSLLAPRASAPIKTATIADEGRLDEGQLNVEKFFKAAQDFSNEVNILPYLFDPEILANKLEDFKLKLSSFPLIIIDWQLEDKRDGKNGLDVFEKIIDNNEVLHYYAIYSKEISTAVSAFGEKYTAQIGRIGVNEIAVIGNNAIVLFCDKIKYSITDIIDQLCTFTEENYGFLPQMFLNVKHQIEDRSAVLYNQFMGLDSMMLPQLIADEVYNYEGLQDEVLISVIFNQLRNSVRIENNGNWYLQSVINKLLKREFLEEDFNRAKEIVNNFSKNLDFEKFNERLKKINDEKYLKTIGFDGLLNAAQIFCDGNKSGPEDKKVKEKIQEFILFLSVCSDEKYYAKYIKLLSLIKFTEYKNEQQWTLENFDEYKVKGLCQGDVFIDDSNSFLICVTPSCQLMRPEKINNTYTFLKGYFAEKKVCSNQKQAYTMHLVNKDKSQVLMVNFEFYSPVILDFSKAENVLPYKKYKRYYRLNTEYIHKLVELYSEHIKQIGVEELFGKIGDKKGFFVTKSN